MKKLILYNHIGTKLLDLEVFVEGQDFVWQSPKPVAFWLGKICLVDKEPEPEQPVATEVIGTPMFEVAVEKRPEEKLSGPVGIHTLALLDSLKEVKDEPETVDNQSAGDSRISEASEPESVEGLPEQPAGDKPPKGGKKPRKCKAA